MLKSRAVKPGSGACGEPLLRGRVEDDRERFDRVALDVEISLVGLAPLRDRCEGVAPQIEALEADFRDGPALYLMRIVIPIVVRLVADDLPVPAVVVAALH